MKARSVTCAASRRERQAPTLSLRSRPHHSVEHGASVDNKHDRGALTGLPTALFCSECVIIDVSISRRRMVGASHQSLPSLALLPAFLLPAPNDARAVGVGFRCGGPCPVPSPFPGMIRRGDRPALNLISNRPRQPFNGCCVHPSSYLHMLCTALAESTPEVTAA